MTQKKLFAISLAALTLAAATAVWFVIFSVSSSGAAKGNIEYETSRLKEQTKSVKRDIDSVKQELSDIDTELSTSDTINSYYMEYKKTHDDLTQEINELEALIGTLDREIEEARAKTGTPAASSAKTGSTYTLNTNEIYLCPDNVPAGRYQAKGNGTLTITNASGKTRVSQNLSVAYDNSYTFNLSDKEKIQVTDSVTLTELK